MGIELSVVIPAYNEAARIGPGLRRAAAYLCGRGVAHELLVVDDGSRDATAAVAAEEGARVLRHDRNRGKGAAVKTGVLACAGARVLPTSRPRSKRSKSSSPTCATPTWWSAAVPCTIR
jgi:dolichyl-phosphate beta-glucosyltransferase